jgi:hypothetical protein
MQEPLNNLNSAIDRRIGVEKHFVQRMVQEFDNIRTQVDEARTQLQEALERSRASDGHEQQLQTQLQTLRLENTRLEQRLSQVSQQLGTATATLNDVAPFNTHTDPNDRQYDGSEAKAIQDVIHTDGDEMRRLLGNTRLGNSAIPESGTTSDSSVPEASVPEGGFLSTVGDAVGNALGVKTPLDAASKPLEQPLEQPSVKPLIHWGGWRSRRSRRSKRPKRPTRKRRIYS